MTCLDRFRSALRDKRGLESLEYAMLALLLVVAIWGFVAAMAPGVSSAYEDLGNWIVDQANAI